MHSGDIKYVRTEKSPGFFFGMLPCVPIKSLPHFSLQKRENCVLLTLILACWFALILPCKKKRFSGRGTEKKSLLKESCSTAGAKPFCYSSNKKKRYLKIRSKFTPHHPRILKIGIKQLDMVFEAKLKIG